MQQKEITQIAVLINKVENMQADITDIKATLKADTVKRVEFDNLEDKVKEMKEEGTWLKRSIVGVIIGLISLAVSNFIFKQ